MQEDHYAATKASIFVQNGHRNFLLGTDLETDDALAEFKFAIFLWELACISEEEKINLAFLVGEGNSAMKVARQIRIIESLQAQGLFKNITISKIIRGYGKKSAQKGFEMDGAEYFPTKEERDKIRETGEAKEEEIKEQAQADICAFLEKHENVAVIGIKPLHEIVDLASTKEGKSLLSKHTLYQTGSYNFRTLFLSREDSEEVRTQKENAFLESIDAFKKCYFYESHFGHDKNSFSSNDPEMAEFFRYVNAAQEGEPLFYFKKFMRNWNAYLLSKDVKELPDSLDILERNHIFSKETQEAHGVQGHSITRDTILSLCRDQKRPDVSDEAYKALEKFLWAMSALKNSREVAGAIAKIRRVLKKWADITTNPDQLVNSDPSLMSVLCGACEGAYHFVPVKIKIASSGYTVVEACTEGESSTCMVCLPFGVSPADFNTFDTLKRKRADTLTPEEREELTKLTHQIEPVKARLIHAVKRDATEVVAKMHALAMTIRKEAAGVEESAPMDRGDLSDAPGMPRLEAPHRIVAFDYSAIQQVAGDLVLQKEEQEAPSNVM